MKDDVSMPAHRVPLALARSFRRGATKHLTEAVWELSRSLWYYRLHAETLSIQALREFRLYCVTTVGFQQRTKPAAFVSPLVEDASGDAEEVVTPNVRANRRGTD